MTAAPSLPRAPDWIPFEGPLDFLLEEVRRQNVALERIQMAPLVARYSEYIRTARDRNLDLDIEWLHTAAQLILWKSRSLLPRDPASPRPAADAIRDELVEELRRHRERMAKELGTRLAGEQARLARGSPESFAPERWAELQEPGGFAVRQRLGPARPGSGFGSLVRRIPPGSAAVARNTGSRAGAGHRRGNDGVAPGAAPAGGTGGAGRGHRAAPGTGNAKPECRPVFGDVGIGARGRDRALAAGGLGGNLDQDRAD